MTPPTGGKRSGMTTRHVLWTIGLVLLAVSLITMGFVLAVGSPQEVWNQVFPEDTPTNTPVQPTAIPIPEPKKVWKVLYFQNKEFIGVGISLPEVDSIDFDWGVTGPMTETDNFSLKFEREFGFDGIYRLDLRSDDWSEVFINESLVGRIQANGANSFEFKLHDSTAKVMVNYVEDGGLARLKLDFTQIPAFSPTATPTSVPPTDTPVPPTATSTAITPAEIVATERAYTITLTPTPRPWPTATATPTATQSLDNHTLCVLKKDVVVFSAIDLPLTDPCSDLEGFDYVVSINDHEKTFHDWTGEWGARAYMLANADGNPQTADASVWLTAGGQPGPSSSGGDSPVPTPTAGWTDLEVTVTPVPTTGWIERPATVTPVP